jgi:hypothetical protein
VCADLPSRENTDQLASVTGKDTDPFQMKRVSPEDEFRESAVETAIHRNSRPNPFWSDSTPAAAINGPTMTRPGSAKRTLPTGLGVYSELSGHYSELSESRDLPKSSTEDFGKIAGGILEELNARTTGTTSNFCNKSSETSNYRQASHQSVCATNL